MFFVKVELSVPSLCKEACMQCVRLFSWCLVVFVAASVMVGIAHARDVTVGIGFSLPPYVIKEEHAGLEVDIIRESFAAVGMNTQFMYLPKLRLPVAFADSMVDCVATNATYDMSYESGLESFDSDVTLVYQNYAVAMKRSGFNLQSINDLKDKVVLSFNNAVKYLGSEYAAMATENLQYKELADQSLQVRMLYSGRVQVVVSDKRIFLYWRKKLLSGSASEDIDIKQDVQFFSIFPPSPRNLSFKDRELCDAFNRGLRSLHKNGAYDVIVQRYAGIESE